MGRLKDAPLIHIDQACFETLVSGGKIVEADGFGPKVYLLPDSTYLKIFRRKRWLSSAMWSPYAQRFSENCRALAARGVPCPEIIAIYRIPSIERDAVHYRPLPGQTVRQILKQCLDAPEAAALRRQLGGFVAHLHGLGVYFRSLHLGNVVRTPQGELGLIDTADMRIFRRGLGRLLRARNLKHMRRHAEEGGWLGADGEFFIAYRQASAENTSA